MTLDALSLPKELRVRGPARGSWSLRRLVARYRYWRIAMRREIFLVALARRERLGVDRPISPNGRWLEQLLQDHRIR